MTVSSPTSVKDLGVEVLRHEKNSCGSVEVRSARPWSARSLCRLDTDGLPSHDGRGSSWDKSSLGIVVDGGARSSSCTLRRMSLELVSKAADQVVLSKMLTWFAIGYARACL